MKVKFLRNGAGFGYGHFAGDVVEITDTEKLAKLIKNKVVASFEDGASDCELPEDIPYRDTLEQAGINSLDDLAKYASDYKKIKGIGPASEVAIKEWLAKQS